MTESESKSLSHLDADGAARMVDVSGKSTTHREAVAAARVEMRRETLALVADGQLPKGDVLAVARLAGIMAAKRTGELIPLCHPLPLSAARVEFRLDHDAGVLHIEASCSVDGRTGVEMEALTAASVAALTIYDMCKAVEKGMRIAAVELVSKTGGKSGAWHRDELAGP